MKHHTSYKVRKDLSGEWFADRITLAAISLGGVLGVSIFAGISLLNKAEIDGLKHVFPICGGISAAFILTQNMPAVFTNNTDVPIYVKDEYSNEVSIVMPGTKTAVLDGFKYRGKLYKISNGVHATLNADGTVSYKNWLHKNLQQSQGEEYIFKAGEGWGELNEANEEELK